MILALLGPYVPLLILIKAETVALKGLKMFKERFTGDQWQKQIPPMTK